jgi:hypothetical protein
MSFIIEYSSIEADAEDGGMGDKLVKLAEPRIYGYTKEERDAVKAGKAGKGTHFKLYDDDGNCYYTGKYFGDADSEEAFEPLEWGYGAGCTHIKYRQQDGTYEVL